MHRLPCSWLLLSLLLGGGAWPSATLAAAPKARKGAKPALSAPKPPATYWIEAETSTSRSFKLPSLGQMMMGGQPSFTAQTSRSLALKLESNRIPAGAPQAEHRIPAGLQLGATLPLLTPKGGPALAPGEIPPLEPGAKARLLRFWGCGAQAGPGQPEVIELGLDRTKLAEAFKALQASPRSPAGSSGTTGAWPSGSEAPKIPLTASLVGEHSVNGNYAPDIRFNLDASKDFLGAIDLKASPDGEALRLSWGAVPQALAYGGQVIGLGKGGSRENQDIVIWTSAAQAGGLRQAEDELTPAVIAKLVSQGDLLGPERSSCVMSAEARRAMAFPTSSLKAYGGVSVIPGPDWVVRLERTSSAILPPMEGLDPAAGGGSPEADGKEQKGGGFNPFRLF